MIYVVFGHKLYLKEKSDKTAILKQFAKLVSIDKTRFVIKNWIISMIWWSAKRFLYIIWKMKEKSVQNKIEDFLHELWHYAVSVQSWSILKKSWRITYKVTLAPQWTPDILACINWRFFWIEVKKDEETRKERCWIADRYATKWQEAKSNKRQIEQFKTWIKITDCKWLFVCTYSLEHLIQCFREFEQSEQIKILSLVDDW